MPAEARVTATWKKQKFFLILFLLGTGSWFFYDGAIGFPRSNAQWLVHDQLKQAGRIQEWPALALGRNWNKTPPHKFYSSTDIKLQFVLGTVAALLGAGMLAWWIGQINRLVKSDGQAVYTPGGRRIPLEAITGMDDRKWKSKGLATVTYRIDGKQGRFTLDDYKFDPEPSRLIFEEIAQKLAGPGR